jgi:hypothetical protein
MRSISAFARRHLFLGCVERRARGAVKTDADHTRCFECHRAFQNSPRELNRGSVARYGGSQRDIKNMVAA